jgi:hypothetical protein
MVLLAMAEGARMLVVKALWQGVDGGRNGRIVGYNGRHI